MLLIAAPGQGAQAPGFLREWLELPGFSERLGSWSELAGCDLIRCGTTADADEIRDTAIAQPLLVATAIAVATELLGGPGRPAVLADTVLADTVPASPVLADTVLADTVLADTALADTALADTALAAGVDAAAGHSVGELGAGAIAGVLAPEDAIRLVRVRAQAMARAAAAEAIGMTAILGGDEQAVLGSIEAHGLTPANVNGAGQIVAAGTMDQLAAFAADPPPGARLRPLPVAGAFHTRHMEPAVPALREVAATVTARDPVLALLSNRDGSVVRSGADWLERIVTQVSAPVRWDKCQQTMASLGVSTLIELPPAGTLTGLARRALPGVRTLGLKSPGDLEQARALLAAGHDTHTGSPAPDWRLLVAPRAGTFRGTPARPGTTVSTGAELGHVEIRGGNHTISPAFPATIIEWLVEDGDPVSAGQPLVRLQPDGTE